MNKLPQAVKICLWSYDTTRIDLSSPEDRFRIVLNILNRGSRHAVDWLWKMFNNIFSNLMPKEFYSIRSILFASIIYLLHYASETSHNYL